MVVDFHKIGGYALFPPLLSHRNPEIRWRTAELIATLVQNNPYCQEAALSMDLMGLLLATLANDISDDVRIKALFAVSCE